MKSSKNAPRKLGKQLKNYFEPSFDLRGTLPTVIELRRSLYNDVYGRVDDAIFDAAAIFVYVSRRRKWSSK